MVDVLDSVWIGAVGGVLFRRIGLLVPILLPRQDRFYSLSFSATVPGKFGARLYHYTRLMT